MDSHKAERRALRWLVFSAVLWLGTVVLALWPSNNTPMRWLLPLGTFCNAVVWLELWRGHRKARSARPMQST